MTGRDGQHWAAYNDAQGEREVRELCSRAMALAGYGDGRVALDLGCGAGVETRALLADGWRVHAIDSAPGTRERVLMLGEAGAGPAAGTGATVGNRAEADGEARAKARVEADRLAVAVMDLAEVERLPDADLVYSGYSLQYVPPEDFRRVWVAIRECLRPGALVAVNLLGDRDEWAGTPGETFLAESEVRGLFEGLEVVHFAEEDADGPAYGGPKHWHVFDVIARAR